MKLTKIGSDYIKIDESSISDRDLLDIPRVHLIKLAFRNPNRDKVEAVLNLFPKTNRFVIKDNIRDYNFILRNTSKKYYVENAEGASVISFFRKNNKVLLNFHNLTYEEREFLLDHCFEDVLRNLEVIYLDEFYYKQNEEILKSWKGNVIVDDDNLI